MSSIKILKSLFHVIRHQNQFKRIEYFKINVEEHGDLYLYKVSYSDGTMVLNIYNEIGAQLNLDLYVDYPEDTISLTIYHLVDFSLTFETFTFGSDLIQMNEIELVLSISRDILDENLRINILRPFLNSECLDKTLSRAIFLSDSDIEGI